MAKDKFAIMVTSTKTTDQRRGPGAARRRVPAPDRLRGLAHPVRVRVLAALRTAGPSTATALAQRLGLNSGATSYHLRQLAAYGFIVEADELGNRRDRFWKVPTSDAAPSQAVSLKPSKGPVADVEARAAYLQARLVEQTDAAQAAVEAHPGLDKEWSDASAFDTHIVQVDATRAEKLLSDISALIEKAAAEGSKAAGSKAAGSKAQGGAKGEADARLPFVVQVQGFLAPHQPS